MKRFIGAVIAALLFTTLVYGRTGAELRNVLETLYPREAPKAYIDVQLRDIPGNIAYVEYVAHNPEDGIPVYVVGFDRTVAEQESDELISATLAHEIGHIALMHHNYAKEVVELGVYYNPVTEMEADNYAVGLVGYDSYLSAMMWFAARFRGNTQVRARLRILRMKHNDVPTP